MHLPENSLKNGTYTMTTSKAYRDKIIAMADAMKKQIPKPEESRTPPITTISGVRISIGPNSMKSEPKSGKLSPEEFKTNITKPLPPDIFMYEITDDTNNDR